MRHGKQRPEPAWLALAGIAGLSLTLAATASAQDQAKPSPDTLESIQVTGDWLGSGLQNSVQSYAGARTVVERQGIADTGATSIGDVMRRIPGVQSTDNSGTAGSAISLNIGVRGLTGRYTPRSTVLLDGIPMAVAPYGQPQLSFAPVSLANIESIDVVRGGGAVRYGPQNVGGIINFNTRPIPTAPGLTADATVRQNIYTRGGGDNTQYSAFIGSSLDNGFGMALLYSGLSGTNWREGSRDRVNDVALKFRQQLGDGAEVYGKLSYYDVKSRTPGGLTVAQYRQDRFQNTRPTDYWNGDRKAVDVGYLNTLSDTSEVEVRVYYNESRRASALINNARTQITRQPRSYQTLGIEPRYTQRLEFGPTTHDVTVGYRYLRERGDDRAYNEILSSGRRTPTVTYDNATDAHAVYIDDRISAGDWRITPGLRYERITSQRELRGADSRYDNRNTKALPSLNVAYLLTPALTLFSNYGTSFGPVQNTQLNSQSDANPLKPEVARTLEAGARLNNDQVKAELTAFKIKFDNQILQVPGVVPATFRNLGATDHIGLEAALEYAFDRAGPLAGLSVYANYTYTRAKQKSGEFSGLDVPFYARNTGTLGTRYQTRDWTWNLSTTMQSGQFSDAANTGEETPDARVGRIPGMQIWNAQVVWRNPNWKGNEFTLGVNNLLDRGYYTRNVDGNAGRMAGAPRMVYVQARLAY